jgi:hypothetical protein
VHFGKNIIKVPRLGKTVLQQDLDEQVKQQKQEQWHKIAAVAVITSPLMRMPRNTCRLVLVADENAFMFVFAVAVVLLCLQVASGQRQRRCHHHRWTPALMVQPQHAYPAAAAAVLQLRPRLVQRPLQL